MKNTTNFPPGWDEERVQRVLRHYDSLNEDETVAEDEAAFDDSTQTVMDIPHELVPTVRALLADRAGWLQLSRSYHGLQVADYCCWAIFRKWQKGESPWYDCIKPTVRGEFDVSCVGTEC